LPLSEERVRIEIFLPDSPDPAYASLTSVLENEIALTFGGCSTIQGIKGLFCDKEGNITQDRISLLFVDIEFSLTHDAELIRNYVDTLQDIVSSALDEEEILIAVQPIYHQATQRLS